MSLSSRDNADKCRIHNVIYFVLNIQIPPLRRCHETEYLILESFPITHGPLLVLGAMAEEACCTCATLLSAIPPQYAEKTEKPIANDRRLPCCGRVICGACIAVRMGGLRGLPRNEANIRHDCKE